MTRSQITYPYNCYNEFFNLIHVFEFNEILTLYYDILQENELKIYLLTKFHI